MKTYQNVEELNNIKNLIIQKEHYDKYITHTVTQIVKSDNGFTREEVISLWGSIPERWSYGGWTCGCGFNENRFCTYIDYGGFNRGSARDLVKEIEVPHGVVLKEGVTEEQYFKYVEEESKRMEEYLKTKRAEQSE